MVHGQTCLADHEIKITEENLRDMHWDWSVTKRALGVYWYGSRLTVELAIKNIESLYEN